MISDEVDEITKQVLKKPEIKRDEAGRFEQHGKGLIKKTQKNKMKDTQTESVHNRINNIPPEKRGGSRKGIPNKITANLKEAILRALDKLGGDEYLVTLGIENSSAFAGLLGKVLPAVLAASADSNGGDKVVEFVRVIVMPNGDRYIEGKTPKALPKPDPHVLPSDDTTITLSNEIKDLD